MDSRRLAKVRAELEGFLGRLLMDLPRRNQRDWAQAYVRGLLLDGQRKSIEPMARRLEAIDRDDRDYEQALQQMVNQSPWSAELVRQRLGRWRAEQSRRSERRGDGQYLIFDDTGFPKQGRDSVGVARQYSGTLGKVGNCQVAVTLQHVMEEAGGGSVCCVDAQLYLPKEWTQDRPRMDRAGVPPEVGYQAKWQMALEMLGRAQEQGLGGIVLADSLFGKVTAFRQGLEEGGWTWCVGVDSTLSVIDAAQDLGPVPAYQGMGRPPTRPALVAAKGPAVSAKRWAMDHTADFRKVTWREGSKGKMSRRFAAWRVRPAHRLSDGRRPQPPCWLLVEWPEEEPAPTRFFLSNLPADTSLKRLVRVAKSRWWVEHSYREMKDELGLDHFEGRFWRGWHHHVTLVLLTCAFLIHLRTGKGGGASSEG
jgi:SRSO17 transposase